MIDLSQGDGMQSLARKIRFLLIVMIIFLVQSALFSYNAKADHVGCAVFIDKELCETESEYTLKSDKVNWIMSKENFQNKIYEILENKIILEGRIQFHVYLWVNDFNTMSALKIQVWNEKQSLLISLPLDLNQWQYREQIKFRLMPFLPYPLSYGYTLGELLLVCKNQCTEAHSQLVRILLSSKEIMSIEVLNQSLLILKIKDWDEENTLKQIKNQNDFLNLFDSADFSPVIEANGFSSLGFSF